MAPEAQDETHRPNPNSADHAHQREGRTEGTSNNRLDSQSEDSVSTTSLFIGNLPRKHTTEAVVCKLLEKYGRVVRISIPDSSTGYAFGEMSTIQEANTARAALHGRKLGGRLLSVRVANGRKTDPKRPTTKTKNSKKNIETRIQAIRRKLDTNTSRER